MPIVERLENWGACYRDHSGRQSQTRSFEGRYRSAQSEHWLYGMAPPTARPGLDWQDAEIINGAWQAIPDSFHACVTGAWYVRRWSPGKCVRTARAAAGDPRERREVTDAEWQRTLDVAHGLLLHQLATPAVERRVRLSARVREALGLEVWHRALPVTPRVAA